MNEERTLLENYLRFLVEGKRSMNMAQQWPYSGIEDFLLKHGQWMEPTTLDRTKYGIGAPKSCYGNAILLAATKGLRYVEGMAICKGLPIPVQHAWNLDKDGNVVDNTWHGGMVSGGKLEPAAYLGVEFSLGRAIDAVWHDDCSVLDNYGNNYVLYRQDWKGEDFSIKWRKSREANARFKAALLLV